MSGVLDRREQQADAEGGPVCDRSAAAAGVLAGGDDRGSNIISAQRCHVNGGCVRLGCVVLRSDGEGEFGEGAREPMLWILIHAEFVVATSKVLDEGVSGADHLGRARSFTTAHRP
jgi:hypothetical protein